MAASPSRSRLSPLALAGVLVGAAIIIAPLVWTLLLSLKANSELVGNSGAALSTASAEATAWTPLPTPGNAGCPGPC